MPLPDSDSDSDSDLISFVAKEAVNNIVNAVSSWKTEGHRDRDKATQTDREGERAIESETAGTQRLS